LEWYTKKVVVSYLVCERCRRKEYYVEENKEQGVISRRQWKEMRWCGCSKVVERKVAYPTKEKVQQRSAQPREPEGIAKEESSLREVRRTF